MKTGPRSSRGLIGRRRKPCRAAAGSAQRIAWSVRGRRAGARRATNIVSSFFATCCDYQNLDIEGSSEGVSGGLARGLTWQSVTRVWRAKRRVWLRPVTRRSAVNETCMSSDARVEAGDFGMEDGHRETSGEVNGWERLGRLVRSRTLVRVAECFAAENARTLTPGLEE